MLPYQSSFSGGRGRSRDKRCFSVLEYGREHSQCTRKDESWSQRYSMTKDCSVKNSGSSTSWFSLCYTRVKGFSVARKTHNFQDSGFASAARAL